MKVRNNNQLWAYKEDSALRGRKTPGKGTEWQFARTDKMARFSGLFSEFGKIFKRRKISFVIKSLFLSIWNGTTQAKAKDLSKIQTEQGSLIPMITYLPGYIFIRDWKAPLGALWVGCGSWFVMNKCWSNWSQVKNVRRLRFYRKSRNFLLNRKGRTVYHQLKRLSGQ